LLFFFGSSPSTKGVYSSGFNRLFQYSAADAAVFQNKRKEHD
jgi:hypothetical protein